MSNFDFKKLREQVIQTGQTLRKEFRGSDAHITAAQERALDPNWRANLSTAVTINQSKPKYLKHMSKQRLEAMDKPVKNSDETLREKLTKANRISAQNPQHHANRTKANRLLKDTDYWKEAHAQGVLSYSQEVQTPNGVFPALAQWMKKYKKPGGRSFLKSLPHLFYLTETGPGTATYERIFHTPFGPCATNRHAHELCRKHKDPSSKLNNVEGWWLKMAARYPKEYYIEFAVARYWPVEKNIPIGMLELESKPRIQKSKLAQTKATWKQRLKNAKPKSK